jgi:hypothetical protein
MELFPAPCSPKTTTFCRYGRGFTECSREYGTVVSTPLSRTAVDHQNAKPLGRLLVTSLLVVFGAVSFIEIAIEVGEGID